MHLGCHGVLALCGAHDTRGDDVGIGVADFHHGILQIALIDRHLALHDDHRVRPRLLVQLELVNVPVLVAIVVGGEITGFTVQADEEIDFVVLRVDGRADVDRRGPLPLAVHLRIEDVLTAEAVVTVGGEIERLAVGVQERRPFVSVGVDGRPHVDGVVPGAVALAGGIPDVGTAVAARTVAGEEEHPAVGAERRLRLPRVTTVDLALQRFRLRPAIAVVFGEIEVVVGIRRVLQLHIVPLHEDQQVVGEVDGGTPLPFRVVERLGQRGAHTEIPAFFLTAAEKLALHLPALSERGIIRHVHAAGEVKVLSVRRKRAEILVRRGRDVRHRVRVERHGMVEDVVVETGFPQNHFRFVDILVRLCHLREKVGVFHDDRRELHRIGKILVEIGEFGGIEVMLRLVERADVVYPVEGGHRLGHIRLVLAFRDKVVVFQREVIPHRIVVVHFQTLGMVGQNLLVELVGFLPLAGFLQIPRLLIDLLDVLVHRLHTRVVVLREPRTGECHA